MRLLHSENKKILQNPSFYFVILLILASIIINAFYFTPKNTISYNKYDSESFEELLLDFNTNIKFDYEENYYNTSKQLITLYKTRNDKFSELYDKINNSIDFLDLFYNNPSTETRNNLNNCLNDIFTTFKFSSTSKRPIYFLINENIYYDYVDYIDDLIYKTSNTEQPLSNNDLVTYLKDKNSKKTLISLNDYIFKFNISDNLLTKLENLDLIHQQTISNILNSISIDTEKDSLVYNINKYCLQQKTWSNYVVQSILYDGLKNYSEFQISNFLNVDNLNLYELNENNLRNEYLIKNQKSYLEYRIVSGITNKTSYNNSVYDFAYICTEVALVIIVFYMLFTCAYTISGEYSRGTLKLLLIRPYKRDKIILSKILSIFMLTTFMLLMSFLSSFIIGSIFIKETAFLPVLVVFNSKIVFTTTQQILTLIYLVSKLIQLLVIILFFILISVLVHNEILAFSVSALCTFITFCLNGLTTKFSILNFLPNLNISLYKFFGGASNLKSEVLSILTNHPTLSVDFYITVGYVITLIITFNIIIFKKFKKLDVK